MKKIISAILLAGCVLGCTACGGSAADTNTPAGEQGGELTLAEQYYALASQDRVEDAYYSLLTLSRQGDAKATELLADFSVGYNTYSYKDKDGVKTEHTFTYDDKGFMTKKVEKVDKDEKTYEYTYNDKGMVATEKFTNKYGKVTTTAFTYNDAGVLTSKTVTDPQKNDTVTTYTYNDAGKVTFAESKNKFGDVDTITYTYDDKNRLTKEEFKYFDGTDEYNEYTYNDDSDLPATMVVKEKDGKKTSYEFYYNSLGKMLNKIDTNSRGRKNERKYTYDDKGNLVSETYTYYDGKSESGTYEGYKVYFKG